MESLLIFLCVVSFVVGIAHRNSEARLVEVFMIVDGLIAGIATLLIVGWWYAVHITPDLIIKFDEGTERGLQLMTLVNILIWASPLLSIMMGGWIRGKVSSRTSVLV